MKGFKIQKHEHNNNSHEEELDKYILEENERNIAEVHGDHDFIENSRKKLINNNSYNSFNSRVNNNEEEGVQDQDSSREENDNPLLIRAKLIENEDIAKIKKNENTKLNPQHKDIKTEANGLLQIDPKAVIFKGFEINPGELDNKQLTKYEQRVKVINTSKFPQRINVIPPTTTFFKIKFSRSGLIPCGLAETIIVQFFPQKYQYYYDFLQVNGEENEKLLIPIHAYPVMNIYKYPKYIPRFINFDPVLLNHSDTKTVSFKNLIETSSFEFEFVPVKTSPEIIIQPFYGEILPSSEKSITIKFSPIKYGTYISEYEFRLSEYNFEPIRVTITGVCKVFDKSKLNEQENEEAPIIKKQYPIYKLKKSEKKVLTEEDIQKKQLEEEAKKSEEFSPTKYLKNLLVEKEKSFIDYFNFCENRIRDKEIKYKKFIGSELLTPSEIDQIKASKFNEYKQINWFNRKVYSQIFNIIRNSKQTNYVYNQKFLLRPTFSKNSNNNFFKNRKYFRIMLEAITKIVIHKRANLKLDKLSPLVKSNNTLKNRTNSLDKVEPVILDKVDELLKLNKNDNIIDYKTVVNNKAVDKSQEEKLISNNEFLLDFQLPNVIYKEPFYVSDMTINFSNEKIPYENNIYFDEYKTYNPVDRIDQELLNYKEFRTTGICNYEISLEGKEARPPIVVQESFSNG